MRTGRRVLSFGSRAALAPVLCAIFVGGAGACERSPEQRTALFREAETHFERGKYDAALDDYQAFLERYPQNRLADTARLRIRSLNREVQAVMGRDDMQTPRHVADESDEPGTAPSSQPERETATSTTDAGDGA